MVKDNTKSKETSAFGGSYNQGVKMCPRKSSLRRVPIPRQTLRNTMLKLRIMYNMFYIHLLVNRCLQIQTLHGWSLYFNDYIFVKAKGYYFLNL